MNLAVSPGFCRIRDGRERRGLLGLVPCSNLGRKPDDVEDLQAEDNLVDKFLGPRERQAVQFGGVLATSTVRDSPAARRGVHPRPVPYKSTRGKNFDASGDRRDLDP